MSFFATDLVVSRKGDGEGVPAPVVSKLQADKEGTYYLIASTFVVSIEHVKMCQYLTNIQYGSIESGKLGRVPRFPINRM